MFGDYEQFLFMFSFFLTGRNHDDAQKAYFCFQHWSHSLKNPGVESSVNLSIFFTCNSCCFFFFC